MGTQIELNCNSCDIHDLYRLGLGFGGTGYFLCACRVCGTLTRREVNVTEIGCNNTPQLTCPGCHELLEILPHQSRADSVEDYGPCPRCTGYLYAHHTGLCWD